MLRKKWGSCVLQFFKGGKSKGRLRVIGAIGVLKDGEIICGTCFLKGVKGQEVRIYAGKRLIAKVGRKKEEKEDGET